MSSESFKCRSRIGAKGRGHALLACPNLKIKLHFLLESLMTVIMKNSIRVQATDRVPNILPGPYMGYKFDDPGKNSRGEGRGKGTGPKGHFLVESLTVFLKNYCIRS
jgi:hypothetical protein